MKFVRYMETLTALSLYNVRVWSSNVDEKAFRNLSNRVFETQVAQAHQAKMDARPHYSGVKRSVRPSSMTQVRTSGDIGFGPTSPTCLNLEGFRSRYPDALTEAAVDFGEPPAAQRKEIMRDLKGILTTPIVVTLQYVLCTIYCTMYYVMQFIPFSSFPFRILRTFHHF